MQSLTIASRAELAWIEHIPGEPAVQRDEQVERLLLPDLPDEQPVRGIGDRGARDAPPWRWDTPTATIKVELRELSDASGRDVHRTTEMECPSVSSAASSCSRSCAAVEVELVREEAVSAHIRCLGEADHVGVTQATRRIRILEDKSLARERIGN